MLKHNSISQPLKTVPYVDLEKYGGNGMRLPHFRNGFKKAAIAPLLTTL